MLASVADSRWDVLDVVADENAIAVHAFLEMRFKKDAPPGFPLGAFKAGERIKTRFCGFYKLRDEQDLRVSRLSVPRRKARLKLCTLQAGKLIPGKRVRGRSPPSLRY